MDDGPASAWATNIARGNRDFLNDSGYAKAGLGIAAAGRRLNGGSLSRRPSRDQPAQEYIGHYRQDDRDNDRLIRINRGLPDNLVDKIEDQGKQEHPADAFPAVLDCFQAMSPVREYGPEVWR